MAKGLNKLSAKAIAAAKEPGRYFDGGGLQLFVDTSSRRWVYIYQINGRRREMGLGSPTNVSLADARDLAAEARKLVAAGKDPIQERRKIRAAAHGATFGEVADDLFKSLAPTWRNAKHRQQWENTLKTHGKGLWNLPVATLNTEDVIRVLRPIWTKMPDTARKLRGRIERVLDVAKAKGGREGENPARWKGHLEILLPKKKALVTPHYAAMPFADLPKFMAQLRERNTVDAQALEFTILTAARTGETLGAPMSEIDAKAEVWTVPAMRMKAGKEHRVPLTASAQKIIKARRKVHATGFIFHTRDPKNAASNMLMTQLLRRMGYGHYTVHGFRSTFSDWAGETTEFPREIVEAALAHTVGDKVERAYRRQDALNRRRKLMEAWDIYCAGGRPST